MNDSRRSFLKQLAAGAAAAAVAPAILAEAVEAAAPAATAEIMGPGAYYVAVDPYVTEGSLLCAGQVTVYVRRVKDGIASIERICRSGENPFDIPSDIKPGDWVYMANSKGESSDTRLPIEL